MKYPSGRWVDFNLVKTIKRVFNLKILFPLPHDYFLPIKYKIRSHDSKKDELNFIMRWGYNDQNVKINTKLSYINVTPGGKAKFSL